jgi:predicted nucleotidyltransferase
MGIRSVQDLHSIDIPDTEYPVIQSLMSDLVSIPDIEAIFLYGSYARSEQKPYSYVDIAVVTRSSEPSRSLREHIGSYASKKSDVQVFSDLPLPAQMQVITQGIPLYIKNPEFIRDLIRLISLTYMDLEPMRNRLSRRILGAPDEVF